jgi:3-dehydroquinate synthase
MNREYTFTFGCRSSCVRIQDETPSIDDLDAEALSKPPGGGSSRSLLVCDTHTAPIARQTLGNRNLPLCVLQPGETAKGWASIEAILRAAKDAGLGRDGLFIGVGGGVVSDMTAFAASIYMRGSRLCLVSTSLLGMVDAALGGKTGFDLFGMKNVAGTFYPAPLIYMPLSSLSTLPSHEWKSGMAELIKTAVLDKTDGQETFLGLLKSLEPSFKSPQILWGQHREQIMECIARSVQIKGRIVEADPQETGEERALLNLGHTFAHALESSVGLGQVSHGEAVAWGMVRACELGLALGITPPERGEKIIGLIHSFGYEIRSPHPLMRDSEAFMEIMQGDKKKKGGKLFFVIPDKAGARLVSGEIIAPSLLARIIGETP